MKFLGIDLGWQSGASGLCCLTWQDEALHLLNLSHLAAIPEILHWVDTWMPLSESGVIAVDAPTLIPNATGMRVPDRLTHKHFGRYHAGCYPANLGSRFADRTAGFGLSLEERGFNHAPTIVPRHPGRYQIEVFPHPAIVHLFGLQRILKYKKGRLSDRRVDLIQLCQLMAQYLPTTEPALTLTPNLLLDFQSQISTAPGTLLKALEDQLDSLMCAYVAAHWWYWGTARNQVLGDRTTGYIVVPHRRETQSGAQ